MSFKIPLTPICYDPCMEKNFNGWNKQKQMLSQRVIGDSLYCLEKEIWICFLGINIGSEQDGQGSHFLRPVLVIKVINSQTFLGIPITTKIHHDPYYIKFNLGASDQWVIISQIRLLSVRRLQRFVGVMTNDYFQTIVLSIRKILPQK